VQVKAGVEVIKALESGRLKTILRLVIAGHPVPVTATDFIKFPFVMAVLSKMESEEDS
jgi:hypothetical protein